MISTFPPNSLYEVRTTVGVENATIASFTGQRPCDTSSLDLLNCLLMRDARIASLRPLSATSSHPIPRELPPACHAGTRSGGASTHAKTQKTQRRPPSKDREGRDERDLQGRDEPSCKSRRGRPAFRREKGRFHVQEERDRQRGGEQEREDRERIPDTSRKHAPRNEPRLKKHSQPPTQSSDDSSRSLLSHCPRR